MNSTPSTIDNPDFDYTVVGGDKTNRALKQHNGFSALILNRGGRLYRKDLISQFEKVGINEILCIEGPNQAYEVEALTHSYQSVRFLLLRDEITLGEQVNIGIKESTCPTVIVIWNDMQLPSLTFTLGILNTVKESSCLCTVPVLQNIRAEAFPTLMAPAFYKRKLLKMVPLEHTTRDSSSSLFPYDYCGIYSRELFLRTGGYDVSLKNPYWQKMDFGFRVHMWGERIVCNSLIKFNYTGQIPVDDTTNDDSYLIFFLKNLTVRIRADKGYLPLVNFFKYLPQSSKGFSESFKKFKNIRHWVAINSYRFKQDARSLTELWERQE